MKLHPKLAVLPAALALAAAPAAAMGAAPAQAKAYGRYCKAESKQHVAGQKGTPFSQCVTAMAKLATGKTSSPRAACDAESKKHVAGEKGTPFSRCVSAAAKLKADQSDDSTDTSGDSGSTS